MKPIKTNSNRRLESFVIWFYRILGITFGVVSFDQNDDIIKSKFWYCYGCFGYFFYVVFVILFMIKMFDYEAIKQYIHMRIYLVLILTWYLVCSLMIIAIPMTHQIYGFKVVEIVKKYFLPNFSKFKQIVMIWIAL